MEKFVREKMQRLRTLFQMALDQIVAFSTLRKKNQPAIIIIRFCNSVRHYF